MSKYKCKSCGFEKDSEAPKATIRCPMCHSKMVQKER